MKTPHSGDLWVIQNIDRQIHFPYIEKEANFLQTILTKPHKVNNLHPTGGKWGILLFLYFFKKYTWGLVSYFFNSQDWIYKRQKCGVIMFWQRNHYSTNYPSCTVPSSYTGGTNRELHCFLLDTLTLSCCVQWVQTPVMSVCLDTASWSCKAAPWEQIYKH